MRFETSPKLSLWQMIKYYTVYTRAFVKLQNMEVGREFTFWERCGRLMVSIIRNIRKSFCCSNHKTDYFVEIKLKAQSNIHFFLYTENKTPQIHNMNS